MSSLLSSSCSSAKASTPAMLVDKKQLATALRDEERAERWFKDAESLTRSADSELVQRKTRCEQRAGAQGSCKQLEEQRREDRTSPRASNLKKRTHSSIPKCATAKPNISSLLSK
eukprot:2692223-Rhodomonas_salina.1